MTNLMTWKFWFALRPESLTTLALNLFIGLLVVLTVLAFLIALIKKKAGIYRGLYKKLYNLCIGNTIIGLIFLFFNYEMVPFFSARFWLALWAIEMIVWLMFILRKIKKIPLLKKQKAQEKELNKYLP